MEQEQPHPEPKTRGRPRKITDEDENEKRQRIREYTRRYQEKNYHRIKINQLDKRICNLSSKMTQLLEERDELYLQWQEQNENEKNPL